MIVKRGDMFYADLSPVVGSEQRRNKTCCYHTKRYGKQAQSNSYSGCYNFSIGKNKLPTHIEIGPENSQLKTDSIVLTEQIRTIDKSRLKEKIGHIDDIKVMNKINNALGVSFGLGE